MVEIGRPSIRKFDNQFSENDKYSFESSLEGTIQRETNCDAVEEGVERITKTLINYATLLK